MNHQCSLERTARYCKRILITALVLIVVALGSLKFIDTEFMPTLDKGSIVVTFKRRIPAETKQ